MHELKKKITNTQERNKNASYHKTYSDNKSSNKKKMYNLNAFIVKKNFKK